MFERICKRENNTIYFGNLNNSKVVSEFLIELQSALNAGYQDIILDFSKIESIFPNAAAPISGIIKYYEQNKNIEFIDVQNPTFFENARILNPIDAELEFDDYYKNSLNKVWKFKDFPEVQKLVNTFIEELSRIAAFEDGVLNGLEWSLNEIMDNVLQHSDTSCGFIMGQIHKNTKHIAFCIFDYGIGIYNSLKNSSHKPKLPLDALTLCIKEGITRDKSIGQGNGMYGLSQIIKNNKGTLAITSNKAYLQIINNNTVTKKGLPTISYSNGCAIVDFQLNYDNKISIEEALKIGGRVGNFVNYRIENLENENGEIEYKVKEKARGYGTRKAGEEVRLEIINIHKETKHPINLDFTGVNLVSSSFADELIGKLVLHFGFFGFNNVIRLKNMNNVVQTVVQRSVSQRMAESLK